VSSQRKELERKRRELFDDALAKFKNSQIAVRGTGAGQWMCSAWGQSCP
jgi:tRNA A37 threonylcarbamoyladenosine dehydratase